MAFRLIVVSFMANGGNLAGSDMHYESMGNQEYRITYTLYTDYPTSAPGRQAVLEIKSESCHQYFTGLLTRNDQASRLLENSCSTSTGIYQWVYEGAIHLPMTCPDWTLSVSECCRRADIASIQHPEVSALYTYAELDNTAGEFSSAKFNSLPWFTLLAGQPNQLLLDVQATPLLGLQVTLTTPRESELNAVSYNNGYDRENPIQLSEPIQLEVGKRTVRFTPRTAETGLIAFEAATSYQGRVVGKVRREMRISSLASGNHLPTLSGVDGTSDRDPWVCAGATVCMDFFTEDADVTDHAIVRVLKAPQDAIVQLEEGSQASIHFCWTPSESLTQGTTESLLIGVSDDRCPGGVEQVFPITFHIRNIETELSTTPVTCLGRNDGSASVLANGTTGTVHYFWTPSGLSGRSVTGLPAGTQTVTVVDESGCSFNAQTVVDGREGFDLLSSTVTPSLCSNSNEGSINLHLAKPSSDYQIDWSPSMQHDATASSLLPGIHTADILDHSTGCRIRRTFTVGYDHVAPSISLGENRSSCLGRSEELTPGAGLGLYQWNDGSTSPTLSVTQSGTYTVEVTDAHGCLGLASVSLEFNSCTSVPEMNTGAAMSIYPNPVEHQLHVDFGSLLHREARMVITDVLGHEWLTLPAESHSSTAVIPVDNLQSGVYLLFLEEHPSGALRFIKQ